jgi:hypothetical protein
MRVEGGGEAVWLSMEYLYGISLKRGLAGKLFVHEDAVCCG